MHSTLITGRETASIALQAGVKKFFGELPFSFREHDRPLFQTAFG